MYIIDKKNWFRKRIMFAINKLLSNVFNYISNNLNTIIKFGTMGILTTLVYLLFIYIFYDLLLLDYKVSISLAYIIGVIFQFISNQTFTFQVKKISFVHVKKYSFLPVINYIHTLFTSLIIVGQLNYTPYISAILSTIISAIISFFTLNILCFKKQVSKK